MYIPIVIYIQHHLYHNFLLDPRYNPVPFIFELFLALALFSCYC